MDSQNRTKPVHPDVGSRIPEKAGSVTHTEDERFLHEYKQSNRKGVIAFVAVIALLTLVFIASFCIGRYSISPARVLQSIGDGIKNGAGEFSKWGTAEDTVVWLVRMPRICAAILVGAALAAAGATYQGLFRNPMVSPDILGASAGASVGACFMMLMNQSSAMIQAGAFVTGIIAVTLSYFLSKAIGRGSNMILLLVLCGMTVNTLFQAVVSIIKYLKNSQPWMYIVCPNFYKAVSTNFSADMNLEEIIAAKPDVVFGSNEKYREMFTAVGIPFINCSFKTYDEMIRSVQLTAEVFGGEAVDIANRYTAYLKERLDWVAKRVEDIPEEKRTTVAHGNSIYELNFDGANTIIDEWIKYAGGINAAAEGMTGNLQTISMEQVLQWDPDVLITGKPKKQVDQVMSDPAWANLKAVKNGRVYSNPKGIFAWDRYGVESALQPQWCAKLLYPELFEDFDIAQELKNFYHTFFYYELSDQQAQMILNYETPKLD